MKTTSKIKIGMLAIITALAVTIGCRQDETTDQVVGEVNSEYVSAGEYNAMMAAKNATEDTLYKTIDEIDNNLRAVREDQGLLSSTSLESVSKRDQILNTIGEISSLLEQNRAKIKRLDGQLATLRSQKKQWSKESEEMKASLASREAEMARLQKEMADQVTTINYLNQAVSELKYASTCANENTRKLDNELHKAHYALGSYKELKQHNVVAKKGGVLGIGRTKTLHPDFEKTYFTEIDTRQVKVIPVNSKKAKLVTHHPVGSYEWEKADINGNVEALTITDPERFWATSKFLVVEVR